MKERVQAHIRRHNLLTCEEQVIVGYSGGADSTCLLHLLKELGYDVVAAHLHHGQRPEADDEQARCGAFAESLGVPFLCGNADVPEIARSMKIGIEEAGRRARYEFFRKVSFQTGGAKIATAHTLDDHVETMLLNLARGAGGLKGIPVERDGIIRPLLGIRRAETRRHCEERGFWFHDDPGNDDPRFSRVAIRQAAIPALLKTNSKALENAARLAEIAGEEDSMLDGMAAAMLEACEIKSGHPLAFLERDSRIVLDPTRLRHYPFPLLRRGVRLLASALGANADYPQSQAAAEAIRDGKKISVTFEEGKVVFETGGEAQARSLKTVAPYRQPLTVPGDTIADDLNWTLAAYETNEELDKTPRSLKAVIDANAIKGSLFARPVQSGDALTPVGQAERKLKGLLTNAKVSRSMKDRLPIVCDLLGPIWVPSVALADRVKLTEATKRRLALQLSPNSTD